MNMQICARAVRECAEIVVGGGVVFALADRTAISMHIVSGDRSHESANSTQGGYHKQTRTQADNHSHRTTACESPDCEKSALPLLIRMTMMSAPGPIEIGYIQRRFGAHKGDVSISSPLHCA